MKGKGMGRTWEDRWMMFEGVLGTGCGWFGK